MNKRVKLKKSRNENNSRFINIIEKINDDFSVINLKYEKDSLMMDEVRSNVVCIFGVEEISDIICKIVLCKNGYMAFVEHNTYDFDLVAGKSSFEVNVLSDNDKSSDLLNVLFQVKDLFEKSKKLESDVQSQSEIFKGYFDKIKENRLTIEESKDDLYKYLYELKNENSQIKDISVECVEDNGLDKPSVYDIRILMKDGASQSKIEKIYKKVWEDSFKDIDDECKVKFRLASIHKSENTFKRVGNLI